MKHVLCLLLLVVSSVASSYEIELTRTYNKVLVENNHMVVKMNATGEVSISYPEFIKDAKTRAFNASVNKLAVIDGLVNQLDFNTTGNMLQNKLKVIKRNHNTPLFYSSEVDLIQLVIKQDDVVWKVSMDNLAELQQHYEYMGSWQPLLDLIKEIQSWSQQALQPSAAGATP
ncbi:hypothetical protein OS175_04030 [Marinicella sp. S1101]|uniref:hypothetical protein n=1 Tax=Marinicella marina TaxID=2996016 RepID=UPI002260C471|nr:hypothetical protein [Marinicella marina]MCX7553035.1 hypothetical protein [Marinicella marina]MDJ1139605.1 hypothetical protein [Marinicella marina]